ncbi:MAG TPA: M12 family metallo-peptidase [Ignavibacteria bacterium]|nr:M12 family metallo-peptidase [Ignavibacteria bacterium]
MKKTILLTFLFIFAVINISFGQNAGSNPLFTLIQNDNSINYSRLNNLVDNAEVYSINQSELTNIYNSKLQKINITLPLNSNQNIEVFLEKLEVFPPNAEFVLRTENGNETFTPKDLAISYKGYIKGLENSLVVVTFEKDEVFAMMSNDKGNFILGKSTINDNSLNGKYILYKDTDLRQQNEFHCHTEDNIGEDYAKEINKILTNKRDNGLFDLLQANIAIDVDYVTYNNIYQQNQTAVTNYVAKIMAYVTALYLKDVNVKLNTSYLRIWTTADPYTGANSNAILTQFRNHWNSTQTSVQRTVAHLISRRSGGLGGIAYLNALCANVSSGNGYGFSNTNGPISNLPTYSWDIMVVAHELGHNFGSPHTHSCSWVGGPIDSCYQTEGNCYNGPVIPRQGTIMSYCHLTSQGINLSLGFGTQPKELIRIRAEIASCINPATESILMTYPNGGEIYRTGNQLNIYWGTALTGNFTLQYSVNNGSNWINISSNVNASDRLYTWLIPEMNSTEQALIRIYNNANQSQGDTVNGVFSILYNLQSINALYPPAFKRVNTMSSMTDTLNFVWSKSGNLPTINYKWKIRRGGSNPNTALIYTSNNNGMDTIKTFTFPELDNIATQLGILPEEEALTTWNLTAFNGNDSINSSNVVMTLRRTTVGIQTITEVIPTEFKLYTNYPNPFNPETNIKFDIAKSGQVNLAIYDMTGREVAILVNQQLGAGVYNFNWNAINMSSGIYFYRLTTPDFTDTKRMILVK